MQRLLAGVAVVAALAVPATAGAQGVDETCVLALTQFDPGTINVAFPDDSAAYWLGAYQAAPGTRIRITGRYPHTRYMSFNVYDQAQRPLDALADVEIAPDEGSTNPFLPHARRNRSKRAYTVFIDFGPIPEQRAPNTLYTGTGQGGAPNVNGSFIYRTYVPDKGLGADGGVGLPTVTIEPDGASGAVEPSACTNTSKPTVTGINEAIAEQEGFGSSGPLPPLFDRTPPKWRKFTNLFASVADNLTDSDLADPLFQAQRQLNLQERGGSGGFLSNIHNSYLSAGLNKAHGPIVVSRLKAPTFPDTTKARRMPTGELRYWSVCSNDPATQRFVGCLNDKRVHVDEDGFATFVVSTPANMPACADNWLRWGPNARNVLIYRHMLPADDFAESIQSATFEHEIDTMGEYFPVSRYYATKADAEAVGCAAAP